MLAHIYTRAVWQVKQAVIHKFAFQKWPNSQIYDSLILLRNRSQELHLHPC